MSSYYQTSSGTRWADEPFRLFFPLGIIAAVAGVLLWPLFFAHVVPIWPAEMHRRLMICGFGGAFVTGFLGTAWPRFFESRHLHVLEAVLLALLWLGACLCWSMMLLSFGDAFMGAELAVLAAILSVRVRLDGGLPPPGFLLAYLSVITSSVVLFQWAYSGAPSAWSWLFMWQGFLLLPLMGVGSYLFGRFFPGGRSHPVNKPPAAAGGEAPSRPVFARSTWRRRAGVFIPAVLILMSFSSEAAGAFAAGNWLRAIAVLLWIALALPQVFTRKAPSTRARVLRVALGSIVASFVCRALWPQWQVAMEHFLFLCGFGLAILLVADRVSLGHNELLERMPPRSGLWRWLSWLIVIAAATRVTADIIPSVKQSHYIYAALLWAGISLWWWAGHKKVPAAAPPQPLPGSAQNNTQHEPSH